MKLQAWKGAGGEAWGQGGGGPLDSIIALKSDVFFGAAREACLFSPAFLGSLESG